MKAETIEQAVIEVLTQIQALTQQPCPPIGQSTCPLKDLPGFDSQIALLATVELEAKLECEIPDDINIFVDTDARRPRLLQEITENLQAMLMPKGAADER